jgi:hypothetical protein
MRTQFQLYQSPRSAALKDNLIAVLGVVLEARPQQGPWGAGYEYRVKYLVADEDGRELRVLAASESELVSLTLVPA